MGGETSAYSTHYLAFYDDCPFAEHGAVVSGHQACLVYKLIQEQPSTKSIPRPSAAAHFETLSHLQHALKAWSSQPGALQKIILAHDNDRRQPILETLELAKERKMDVDFALATVEYSEEGTAEKDFDILRHCPRGEWEWKGAESHKLTVDVEHRDGRKYEDIVAQKEDLFPADAIDEEELNEEWSYNSYDDDGLEMPVTRRWVFSEAIMVWPKSREMEALTTEAESRFESGEGTGRRLKYNGIVQVGKSSGIKRNFGQIS